MRQIQMMGLKEISRQPRQQQIKNIIVRTVSDCQPNHFLASDQITKRSALRGTLRIFRLRAAAPYVFALRFRKFGMLAWIPVVQKEEREVNDADDSSHREVRTPSKMHQHCTENRNADGRRELRHRIEHRRGHAAFVFWKPIT